MSTAPLQPYKVRNQVPRKSVPRLSLRSSVFYQSPPPERPLPSLPPANECNPTIVRVGKPKPQKVKFVPNQHVEEMEFILPPRLGKDDRISKMFSPAKESIGFISSEQAVQKARQVVEQTSRKNIVDDVDTSDDGLMLSDIEEILSPQVGRRVKPGSVKKVDVKMHVRKESVARYDVPIGQVKAETVRTEAVKVPSKPEIVTAWPDREPAMESIKVEPSRETTTEPIREPNTEAERPFIQEPIKEPTRPKPFDLDEPDTPASVSPPPPTPAKPISRASIESLSRSISSGSSVTAHSIVHPVLSEKRVTITTQRPLSSPNSFRKQEIDRCLSLRFRHILKFNVEQYMNQGFLSGYIDTAAENFTLVSAASGRDYERELETQRAFTERAIRWVLEESGWHAAVTLDWSKRHHLRGIEYGLLTDLSQAASQVRSRSTFHRSFHRFRRKLVT